VLEAIADAMHQTLQEALGDGRVPAALLTRMRGVWQEGMTYAH
jgi:hypothetical protein